MKPSRDLTVLVVDDDGDCRRILARLLLKLFGCRVLEAGDGAEGLRRLEEERPDLILLDLMMPGMSGREMLAEIRSRPDFRDIPVIICSAVDELDHVKAVVELGITDYILKPYALDTLSAKLTAALKHAAHSRRESLGSGVWGLWSDRKILLVTEDVELFRFVQAGVGAGFCVIHAKDGITAIRLATAERPEAIFLVSPLPGGGDVSLARKLRTLPETQSAKLFRIFSDLSEALHVDSLEEFDGFYLLTSDPAHLSGWIHQALGPSPFRIKEEPGTLIVELSDPDFDRYRDRLLEALSLKLRATKDRHLLFDITAWPASDAPGGTGLDTVIAKLRALGFEAEKIAHPSTPGPPPPTP